LKKISSKIIILAITPTLIVGIALGVMIAYMTGNSGKSSLFAYEETMRRDFDTVARWETETVHTMLVTLEKEHKKGNMSLDSAKTLGAEIIRNMKYGSNGYFWVDDLSGTNIVSSNRSAQGKNRIKVKDVDGKYIIKDFLRKGMNGGGFSDYRFPKVKDGEPKPKRSYLLQYEPFGWVIGTGNYIDDIDEAVEVMKGQQTGYLKIMFIVIIILLVVSSVVILIMSRRIAKPIIKLTKTSKLLAEGNLNVEIESTTDDEIGELSTSMGEMAVQLRQLIESINSQAGNISGASQNMQNASNVISDSAADLASTAEEAASSIEQMSANIQQNSMNADETETISNKIVKDIRISSKAVNKTANALKAITERISFIDAIATKTNTLALNASVEAAGAGKFGNGFSVIAREVKQLAKESADAAAKIQTLSKSGIDIADKSVLMLEKLVPEVEKTAKLVQQINKSSNEQMHSANLINSEVQQLNMLSQKNASISQETERNSKFLSRQSRDLLDIIAFFKMK